MCPQNTQDLNVMAFFFYYEECVGLMQVRVNCVIHVCCKHLSDLLEIPRGRLARKVV